MKNYFLIAFMFLMAFSSCQQKNSQSVAPAKKEVVDNKRYVLFPTENIWTFLKLDTKYGKIWQVQYSIKEDFRGEVELNTKALVPDDAAENGRFTLYPTKNIYNFILLDQKDGKMWQVQWSTEADSRFLIPMQ